MINMDLVFVVPYFVFIAFLFVFSYAVLVVILDSF